MFSSRKIADMKKLAMAPCAVTASPKNELAKAEGSL
jgi:hypothetical protein